MIGTFFFLFHGVVGMVVAMGNWHKSEAHLNHLGARQLNLGFLMNMIVIIITPTYLSFKVVVQRKLQNPLYVCIHVYFNFYYLLNIY